MVVTLSANFGIVSPYSVVFYWQAIKEKFELWRVLTCFCYAGPFEMSTMFCCYMLVTFSRQYEAGPFNTGAGSGTADYAFCLLFGMMVTLVTYPFLPFQISPVFCRNLVYFVLYTWSKRNPTAQANIWGVPMAASVLPFAYLALSVFMGSSYMDMLHGYGIAHIYYFLADVVPLVYGKDVLVTPKFLIDYFGVGEYRPQVQNLPRAPGGVGGFGAVHNNNDRPAAPAAGGGGYTWGGGRPLGRD
jgi:Derlin-2/3